jgi:hypothetical protein
VTLIVSHCDNIRVVHQSQNDTTAMIPNPGGYLTSNIPILWLRWNRPGNK